MTPELIEQAFDAWSAKQSKEHPKRDQSGVHAQIRPQIVAYFATTPPSAHINKMTIELWVPELLEALLETNPPNAANIRAFLATFNPFKAPDALSVLIAHIRAGVTPITLDSSRTLERDPNGNYCLYHKGEFQCELGKTFLTIVYIEHHFSHLKGTIPA